MNASAPVTNPAPGTTDAPLLAATDVTVRFGGVVALDGVSLAVPAGIDGRAGRPERRGQDHALRCALGAAAPQGRTRHHERRRRDAPQPAARARRGLARTFQRMELFTELTVREHLVVARRVREGRERLLGIARDLSGFGERPGPGEDEAVDDILALLGLDSVADRPALTSRSVPDGCSRWPGRWRQSRP